ncbi:MAG: ferritin-like domain-containing protein [Actinobacteria bacterium]|nr:ferritin-like domain-containing protein [Actinomycetota bacterium]
MKFRKNTMQISERELITLTSDLDDMHHDTLPHMHEAIDAWSEVNNLLRSGVDKLGETASSRRTFLIGVGAAAGGLALAACGGSKKKNSGSGGDSGLSGDLAIAALAASLENLAVQTYQAGLDAAGKGSLGAVPAAVATFVKTAQSQHKDHAAAWNSILTKAGKKAITGVDTTVKDAVVTPGFAQVKDVPGLAKFALGLENVAAATYLNGIQNAIKDKGAIQIAASIQPVEMQHAAILNFVLGSYPIPDSFAKTDGARGPDDKIG